MKKVISVFLSTLIAVSLFAVTPLSFDAYTSYEFSDSGCVGNYEERPEYAYNDPKDGTNVTYVFDKTTGTLTLTAHPEVSADCEVFTSIFQNQSDIKHLIVGENITGICNGAFSVVRSSRK